MKATIIIMLAGAFLFGTLYGQNQSPSVPKTMTAEEFIAQARASANTGAERSRLADLAFRSQNIELILTCFREPGMLGSFIRELEKLPPTEFRSRVARSLLTESWPQDKSPLGILPPGSSPLPILETFCLVELAKLLPSANLDPDNPESIDKLRDKSFRMRLSRQIDANVETPKREK